MKIDLYNLDYDERESLYMELETRYIDYCWIEEYSYNKKYNKWTYELIGYLDEIQGEINV